MLNYTVVCLNQSESKFFPNLKQGETLITESQPKEAKKRRGQDGEGRAEEREGPSKNRLPRESEGDAEKRRGPSQKEAPPALSEGYSESEGLGSVSRRNREIPHFLHSL